MSEHSDATILLVDDNPTNISLLIDHLLKQSYQLMVAESGPSALARVAQRKPDLILLDVSMPGMDGFETCRRLKADPDSADIPIIFLSALTSAEDKIEGFAAGGADYIAKPIDLAEVVARMNTHLQMREVRRNLEEQNLALSERIEKRTRDLQDEILERKKSELEKELLLGLVREQRGHLKVVTDKLLDPDAAQNPSINQNQLKEMIARLRGVRSLLDSIAYTTESSTQYSLINSQAREAITLFDEAEQIYDTLTTVSEPENLADSDHGAAIASLSERERQIFELIVAGLSNEEIAEHTHITNSTVRTYKLRVMKKLNVTNVPDMVRLAMRTTITSSLRNS